MKHTTTLFWFRQDLRIADNPGLLEAAKNGSVLPIFILDDANEGMFKKGTSSRWGLHHSLQSLNKSLDNKLAVYSGDAKKIIQKLVTENNITSVHWNRCYEPYRIAQDAEIEATLTKMGVAVKTCNASLLHEPQDVLKDDGTPYKMYTPFYRKGYVQGIAPREPLPVPTKLVFSTPAKAAKTIESLDLLPDKKRCALLEKQWLVGEKEAHKKVAHFLKTKLDHYKEGRDFPGQSNTSHLSPYLHYGEVSPHQVWYATHEKIDSAVLRVNGEHFFKELCWREFSYYLLYHFPELPRKNFQPKFDSFPWLYDKTNLKKWQEGKTGYPLVDAGMRELLQTGYMHNRVRMIVASFLIKNLLIHWHEGEKWFWELLVDADLANNSASWQWIAGSGADAAPYFRIFNPITQGEKFDKEGTYTKKFLPELQKLPSKFLFKPWLAPAHVLEAAGIVLGTTYPKPLIDLQESRKKALKAYLTLT